MTDVPVFVTSNVDKVKHLGRLLDVRLPHKAIELDELQSADMTAIIAHKANQAYESIRLPVLVDDACMGLDALHGLPGPFIKFFVQAKDGQENLCRMADGLSSRRATARAYFGLYDGTTLTVLHGEIHGEIAEHPRGNHGFTYGWDSVFCPDGYGGRTRAELTANEYDQVYTAIRPIQQLKQHLNADTP